MFFSCFARKAGAQAYFFYVCMRPAREREKEREKERVGERTLDEVNITSLDRPQLLHLCVGCQRMRERRGGGEGGGGEKEEEERGGRRRTCT